MSWKTTINPFAVTRRRRVIAGALVYGLSLSVRFTSATGEEVEIAPAAANPAKLITADDGTRASYTHWSLRSVQPIAFQRSWLMPPAPGCAAHP